MLRVRQITAVFTAALILAASPALAQRNWRPLHLQKQPKVQEPKQGKQKKQAEAANQEKHSGDWLRRYKDMPPEQQRQALEKDPQFQRLSPQRQQQLRQRLQRFASLPPQKQERILTRMETWEHLTPDQKRQARSLFREVQQLPPQRRQELNQAIRNMRDLTPDQRDQLINSDQFKGMFSDHERDLLSGASRLPLAPGEN